MNVHVLTSGPHTHHMQNSRSSNVLTVYTFDVLYFDCIAEQM